MTATAHSADDLLPGLVNGLANELALARRDLATSKRKLITASRSLEARTQDLNEAKAAVSLLLATLDSANDGIVAMGYFGRAMHFNTRFIEMWRIPEDALPTLSDASLLALQVAQVKNAVRFLADIAARKAAPESRHTSVVEMKDGRFFECRFVPQCVGGKRIGTVTSFHDATDRELLRKRVVDLLAIAQ